MAEMANFMCCMFFHNKRIQKVGQPYDSIGQHINTCGDSVVLFL